MRKSLRSSWCSASSSEFPSASSLCSASRSTSTNELAAEEADIMLSFEASCAKVPVFLSSPDMAPPVRA